MTSEHGYESWEEMHEAWEDEEWKRREIDELNKIPYKEAKEKHIRNYFANDFSSNNKS